MAEIFGRYRSIGIVGSGAFATVHRARDDRLDTDVAVKVLAENHSLDPEVRERFITEGQLLRRIDCPEVIAAFDLGETERGQPFLVLEYADRGDLATRVRTLRDGGWTPTPEEVLAVARAVASALGAVHRAQVVHRDLSPRNLLLRSALSPSPPAGRLLQADERLALADLGFGKDLAASTGLTVGGGTSGFAPPEQRGTGVVGVRSDLWAASALLVWLVTGEPPGDGESWRGAFAPAPWTALGAVLRRGLADDPARRHASAEEWLADVEAALQPGAADRHARRGRVRRAVVLGVVVVAALAVGLAVGLRAGAPPVEQEVTPLAGGLVSTAVDRGDAHVAVIGPTHIAVGEEATFVAELRGIADSAFVAPDGTVHAGAAVLEVTVTTPGVAEVRLVGTTDEGTVLVAVHEVEVSG